MGNGNHVLHACYMNHDFINKDNNCFLGKVKDIVLNKLEFNEAWN